MINDLLLHYDKTHKEYGDKIVFDSYKPKAGLYIRLSNDKEPEVLPLTKEGLENGEYIANDLYSWFRERDYYSNIIETNKAIDTTEMKIHSNNYLTCFLKRENLPDMITISKVMKKSKPQLTEMKEIFKEVIEQHYYKLSNPREYNKNQPETEKLFDYLSNSLPIDRMDKKPIPEAKNLILNSMDYILSVVHELKIKEGTIIKIFVDFRLPIEEYQEASEMYIKPRIFNNNSYNVSHRNKVYGLSNNNMGLNDKKPFSKLRTSKFEVPYRVDIESALLTKELFNWLNSQKRRDILIPDSDGFIKTIDEEEVESGSYYSACSDIKNNEFTIIDYDYIPSFDRNVQFKLCNFIYVGYKEKDNFIIYDDRLLDKLWKVEKEVDLYFFNLQLTKNYYNDKPQIDSKKLSKKLSDLLIISRKAMHDYFKNSIDVNFKSIIDKVSSEIVKEQFLMANTLGYGVVARALNLRLSLLKHFRLRGENMGDRIKNIIDTMMDKYSEDNNFACNNDEEFFYLSGQLAYYLLSQSEAASKTHRMAEPFLRAKNITQLKRQLRFSYDKYKHAIRLDYSRFSNILAEVLAYEPESTLRINQDIFLAGFLATSKNIFFMKSKKKD